MSPATLPAQLGSMRNLQAAMLAKRKARRAINWPEINWPSADAVVGVTLALCGLAVGVMALAGWLPGAGA